MATPKTVQGISIAKAEEAYNVRYIGEYDLPNREGPFLLFWADNPNRELGHSNYLAIFRRYGLPGDESHIYLTNGKTIEDTHFCAIQLESGAFIVSRYRHDYQTGPRGEMIDGGLAYARLNPAFPVTHYMHVIDGVEVFDPIEPANPTEAAVKLAHEKRRNDRARKSLSEVIAKITP